MTVERVRTYRGISERAARHYLTRVGGEVRPDGSVDGDGWSASVTADRVAIGPSLELTEVSVTFEGDAETLDAVIERFSQ
jgi:hypothetical protein